MTNSEIDQIELKLAQAKAKKERLEAVANEKRRKRETRAKIMIGGTVLKLLNNDEKQSKYSPEFILRKTLNSLNESDKKMFEHWLIEAGVTEQGL